MNRSVLIIIVLGTLAAACSQAPPPVLTCPETRSQIECVDPLGSTTPIMSPADFGVSATVEGGGEVEITCTPEIDNRLTPGEYAVECTARTSEGETASCEFALEAIEGVFPYFECPEDITQACTGALTVVSGVAPTIVEPCPNLGIFSFAVSAVPSPEEGLPVGTTEVQISGGSAPGSPSASCSTQITITDEVPPDLSCESDITVVRESADAPIDGFGPEASDNCSEDLTVTSDMELSERGSYTVTYLTTDAAGNEATCTSEVLVLDVFAPESPRILSAALNPDGSTRIRIGFEPSTGEDVDRYALQSAATPEGPWRDVRFIDADTQVVSDPRMSSDRLWYRIQAASGETRGGATEPVAAFAMRADDYDIRGRAVPGVPFRTTLYGVLRAPVDLTEPRPLILMLHGNHGICRPSGSYADICSSGDFTNHECQRSGYTTTPNAEGMLFLAETLAAQGYISVTISGNAMNCRSDFIRERTALLLEHIRQWKGWHDGTSDGFSGAYRGAVDLSRVGMVGHSRGGEAVAGAPQALAATPIDGVDLASVFAIAPVDFHDPVPSGTHFGVLLPSCDGDVSDLGGRYIYDRSLVPEDAHARAQVLHARANHNYYNTEWRLNDNSRGRSCRTSGQVSEVAQQAMLEATLGSWFGATLNPAEEFEPFMRSEAPTPSSINAWARTELDLRWAYRSSTHRLIDDFEGPDRPERNRLGERNNYSGFTEADGCTGSTCSSAFAHPTKGAVRLRWLGEGAMSRFNTGDLATEGYRALSFRIASRNDSRNSGIAVQSFIVEATDGAGEVASIRNAELIRVPHLYYTRIVRELLQTTVRLPLDRLAQVNPAFDASTIRSLSIRIPDRDRGAFYVSDIELAGNN